MEINERLQQMQCEFDALPPDESEAKLKAMREKVASQPPLTEQEIQHALELAKKHGWDIAVKDG